MKNGTHDKLKGRLNIIELQFKMNCLNYIIKLHLYWANYSPIWFSFHAVLWCLIFGLLVLLIWWSGFGLLHLCHHFHLTLSAFISKAFVIVFTKISIQDAFLSHASAMLWETSITSGSGLFPQPPTINYFFLRNCQLKIEVK